MLELNPKLNDRQREAVEHPAGPLLVLAGPGTGKTGVLIERISHLVGERSVNPERILALTFSRRAADEMRARVTARVPDAERVEVRTFHSFALSVVRRHAGALDLPSAPEIVPTAEQWALVSDVLGNEDPEAWGLPPGAFERPATVREVYDLMLRAQEHLLGPSDLRELGEKTVRPYLVRAGEVLRAYRDRLGRASRTDYEGVVQYALRLLNPGGKAAKEVCGLYDHVLVDEFQDINPLDLALIKAIIDRNRATITIVGDDDQALFEWRGATPEYILNPGRFFDRDFSTFTLSRNYRSPSNVVELSQKLIAHNTRRVEKSVHPARKEKAAIEVRSTDDLNEAMEYVYAEAERAVKGGQSPSRVAIIGRKRSQIIPYQVFFASRNVSFCAAEDLQVFLGGAFDRLLDLIMIKNDCDRRQMRTQAVDSFLELCNVVKRYPLSKADREALRKHLNESNPRTVRAAIEGLASYQGKLKGPNKDGKMALSMAEAIKDFLDTETVSDSLIEMGESFQGLQLDIGKAEDDIFYADPPFL